MIISFPSRCWNFEALVDIPKGTRTQPLPVHYVGIDLMVVAPIDIRPRDIMIVDLRSAHVEIVERDGIAVWRSGWVN